MTNLPDYVVNIIDDFLSGDVSHWKAKFKIVLQDIEELNIHKLIKDYFTLRCSKNGLYKAIDMCYYHIDCIGCEQFWSIIMSNVLEDMRVSEHHYCDKVTWRCTLRAKGI